MHCRKIIWLVVLCLAVVLHSCEVEEVVVVPEEEPVAVCPIEVKDITPHSAVLSGNFLEGVVADSGAFVGVMYSHANTRYLTVTGNEEVAEKVGDGMYELKLDRLYSDTTYYFSIYHREKGELVFSPVYSFRTHKLTIETDSVLDVIAYGAKFGYTLSEPVDRSKFRGKYGVMYSMRAGAIMEYSTRLDTMLTVRDLRQATTYYYRAFVMAETPDRKTVYTFGETRKFDTPPIGVETLDAENVGVFSASLSGRVNVMFDEAVDFGVLRFEKEREVTLDSVDARSDQKIKLYKPTWKSPSGCGEYSIEVGDLEALKTYYYRAYMKMYVTVGGKKTLNEYYGEVKSFRTDEFVISDTNPVDLGLSVSWASKNFGALKTQDIGTEVSYEAAKATDFGDGWRMPTREEAQELVDKCHWTWVTYKRTKGVAITGPNSKTLFVPANCKTGSSYSWGVYLFEDNVDHSTEIKGDYVSSIRFAKDEERDNQSGKTTKNFVSTTVPIALRLVK